MLENKVFIFVGFILVLLILLLIYNIIKMVNKEKFTNPIPDNNYIDIFNNEEIQLRRGSTARVSVPPTVRQALYADKGLVIPSHENCLCEENEF